MKTTDRRSFSIEVNRMIGLYLHIPFCQSKCNYCDFYSIPTSKEQRGFYLRALAEEAAWYAKDKRLQGIVFDTLFIGGGTPSILEEEELDLLFDLIDQNFSFQKAAEKTMEANPGSLTAEKICLLLRRGINRISLGVQAFQPSLLHCMGRCHTSEEAEQTILDLKNSGLKNWSMDLIYGLPGQTLADWRETLTKALQFRPPHLSMYNLIVEETTPFGHLAAEGKLQLPDEEEQLQMMQMAAKLTEEAGLLQYEISNFSLSGAECQHNLIYWHNQEYLGLGAAAFSYLDKHRFSHVADIERYIHAWQQYHHPCITENEYTTRAIELGETIMLGLRTMQGISVSEMNRRFQIDFLQYYKDAISFCTEQGWLTKEGDRIALTSRGIPLGNQVFLRFLPNEKDFDLS
ncbi:MAG TPA: radical SAM family heme chaperone HemW [Bacillota bacterium]|nr:radical SAM family heme chaperone HemW [Bacillota bacterium]